MVKTQGHVLIHGISMNSFELSKGKLISTGSFKKSNEVHILDVATGKWTEGCNRPANNSFVSVCCVFGKLLVCGGGGRQFHLYDPEADT